VKDDVATNGEKIIFINPTRKQQKFCCSFVLTAKTFFALHANASYKAKNVRNTQMQGEQKSF
jgi:hypothetical protein